MEQRWKLTGRRHERSFQGQGEVLHLDRGLGYIDIFICPNLTNIHVKFANFLVYKLCHGRKNTVNKCLTLVKVSMLKYLGRNICVSAIYFEMHQKIR